MKVRGKRREFHIIMRAASSFLMRYGWLLLILSYGRLPLFVLAELGTPVY